MLIAFGEDYLWDTSSSDSSADSTEPADDEYEAEDNTEYQYQVEEIDDEEECYDDAF